MYNHFYSFYYFPEALSVAACIVSFKSDPVLTLVAAGAGAAVAVLAGSVLALVAAGAGAAVAVLAGVVVALVATGSFLAAGFVPVVFDVSFLP